MGFHNFKWFEIGIGIVFAVVMAAIAIGLIQSAFRSNYLLGISCIALCNAIICGIITYYISKEVSFFFLGLLLGEIGIAIAIVVRFNEKSGKHQPSIEDNYAALERLDSLRKKKIITEKEFQIEKSKILGSNQKT